MAHMRHQPVLTLSVAIHAMDALRELHRLCLAMDAEGEGERPSEDEYQAVMKEAASALKNWAAERG